MLLIFYLYPLGAHPNSSPLQRNWYFFERCDSEMEVSHFWMPQIIRTVVIGHGESPEQGPRPDLGRSLNTSYSS